MRRDSPINSERLCTCITLTSASGTPHPVAPKGSCHLASATTRIPPSIRPKRQDLSTLAFFPRKLSPAEGDCPLVGYKKHAKIAGFPLGRKHLVSILSSTPRTVHTPDRLIRAIWAPITKAKVSFSMPLCPAFSFVNGTTVCPAPSRSTEGLAEYAARAPRYGTKHFIPPLTKASSPTLPLPVLSPTIPSPPLFSHMSPANSPHLSPHGPPLSPPPIHPPTLH